MATSNAGNVDHTLDSSNEHPYSESSSNAWDTISRAPSNQPDGNLKDVIQDERGPLLERISHDNDGDDDNDDDDAAAGGRTRASSQGPSYVFAGDPVSRGEETKSTGYIALLTTCMLGLQIGWSVEMAMVSPFLLSLGLSKALLALVWIAGPLSGTVVQPYVGIRSDNFRSRFGRRKPFMVWGTLGTMASLFVLSWTRGIVTGVVGIFGVDLREEMSSPAFQIFAVVIIYILDFAINVMQAAVRAFIVDCTPTHQQETANAWAARVSGMGHILAYFIGPLPLPSMFPWLGDTQFKVFVALACFVMAVTMAVSCLSVAEPDLRLLDPPPDRGGGVVSFFKSLYHSVKHLPRQVKMVCLVQICAWIGWFPFLFYTTTYIGALYAEPTFKANPNLSEGEIDAIWEEGTRVGTFALLIFALVTFASSILVPMIIPPTYKPVEDGDDPGSNRQTSTFSNEDFQQGHLPMKQMPSTRLHRLCNPANLQIPWLTLRRAWFLSHLAFAAIMWLTFFVTTSTAGIVLIGFVGIPWSLTNWAPFALIAAEIAQRNAVRRGLRPAVLAQSAAAATESRTHDAPGRRPSSAPTVHEDDGTADQAGVLLGIHNVAISAPQILATLVSSAMFHALQKPRGTPGDDSVGWVMRFGGLCALAAAWCTRYVREGGPQ